jgi:non-ribosomal peptide synthetase component E (peptide arylation enzyme)
VVTCSRAIRRSRARRCSACPTSGWARSVCLRPAAQPADPPSPAELRAFVGAELASFKRPDGLTVLAEIPVTPMFKVDKRALKALGVDRHG